MHRKADVFFILRVAAHSQGTFAGVRGCIGVLLLQIREIAAARHRMVSDVGARYSAIACG